MKQRSLRARVVEVLEGRNGEGDESTCGETIYRGWEVETIVMSSLAYMGHSRCINVTNEIRPEN